MGLLKPRRRKRLALRRQTALHCVVAGHQRTWCRGICKPIDGNGLCGREAPHLLKGRTQLAIENYRKRHSGKSL